MNLPAQQYSTFAIISLVAGILGWTVLPLVGSIVAIVTGHMARGEIRRSPLMAGDALAVVGLVLGWVAVVAALLAIGAFLMFFGGVAWLSTR